MSDCEFNHQQDFYSDTYLHNILGATQTIALVGISDKVNRASYSVMRFLLHSGFRVIPVSPRLAGSSVLDQTVLANLADINEPVDMVDVFRNSEAAGEVFDQAIAINAQVIWTQLDVVNYEAATRAEKAGLKVVMNRCPAIEIPRLAN